MFIMVDGIDGSGKSTIIGFWKKFLTEKSNTIFDVREYWKKNNEHPAYAELKPYDFIFSAEPTYVGVGNVIRQELIKNGTDYPELAIAEAYSLDRLVLYQKLLIPALADGKQIIQDRGISTSLCYQALSGKLSFDTLAALPGNARALEYRPDHLIIVTIDPTIALKRLSERSNKQDNVIFERLAFQQKAAAMFMSPAYAAVFKSHGTQVHYLSAGDDFGIMEQTSNKLLEHLLSS